MVSGERAGAGRGRLQHWRIRWFDDCAAARGVGDPELQLAIRVCDHRRSGVDLGRALAMALSITRKTSEAFSTREGLHRFGTGEVSSECRRQAIAGRNSAAPEFLGHCPAEAARRSNLGNAYVLAATLFEERQAF